ncbi:MAG: DUF935 domain-containing protein [Clostridiaceae bacterium]|nr:DUF935 domain-containing protein [Clostridiaceae bacterium]
MIIDVHGKPMTTKKPITREIAISSVRDKLSTYPSNGLTPQRLAQIFREADAGDVYRQMELFEEMEAKDAHLFSQMQTRKNAVVGKDFDILPFSDQKQDKRIAEFIGDLIYNMESLEDIFTDLLDAIGKGFSIGEVIWGYDGKYVIPEAVKWRHQKNFFWDHEDIFKVITDEMPMGMEVPPNKFIIHQYKARSGHPSKAGVLRVVAWMYLFKNYNVKDWVAFCETFGMPIRLGKYGPNASEDDKAKLMEALIMIGSDAAGIIPENASIEFKESSKTSSINVFESLANFCNKEMSKAILGQTLTTEMGTSGSYAASQTHDGVRQDLVEADCKALAQTVLRDLIRPLVLFNFGETKRLPYIKFHCEPPEDLEKTAKTYQVLIGEIGLPVATEYLYDKFGIPKPEDGQEVVQMGQRKTVGEEEVKEEPKKETEKELEEKTDETQEKEALELKDTEKLPKPNQETIDKLADNATGESMKLFRKMFKPLEKLLDQTENLEELQEKLQDKEVLRGLYKEMESDELEDLLGSAMFMADLMGRMLEDA